MKLKHIIFSSVLALGLLFSTSNFNANAMMTDCEPGGLANVYCPYWNITITWTFTGPKVACSTGGQFKCKEEKGGENNK